MDEWNGWGQDSTEGGMQNGWDSMEQNGQGQGGWEGQQNSQGQGDWEGQQSGYFNQNGQRQQLNPNGQQSGYFNQNGQRQQLNPNGQQLGQNDQKAKVGDKKVLLSIIITIVVVMAMTGIGAVVAHRVQSGNTSKQPSTSQVQKVSPNKDSQSYLEKRKTVEVTEGNQPKSSTTTLDTPNTATEGNTGNLAAVEKLPEIAKSGKTGGIVTDKKAVRYNNEYLFELLIQTPLRDAPVDYFTTSDVYNAVSKGNVINVNYNVYTDGSVGISGVSSNN